MVECMDIDFWWMVLDLCDKYGCFMFINLMPLKNCWIKSEFLVGFEIKKI